MKHLGVLEERRNRIASELSEVTKEIINEKLRLHKDNGIYEGVVVDHKGRLFKISRIDRKYMSRSTLKKPWVFGFYKNKDGNWSKREVRCYGDYELTVS